MKESRHIVILQLWFPAADTNAGDLRLVEILRLLVRQQHRVTFVAEGGEERDRERLEQMGVACVLDKACRFREPEAIRQFVRARPADVALACRYDTFRFYQRALRIGAPDCSVILDTVDLHHLRLEREARLNGDPQMQARARQARADELEAIQAADSVWVVTELERQHLGRLVADVRVIPTIHAAEATHGPYDSRRGIVFIGGYAFAPNVDAVNSFMRDVYPRIRARLGDVPLTLAGSNPPTAFDAYPAAFPGVEVTGFVPDHRALLRRHRVGIAPLRFGAGMKGKIGEYLGCGLPCVTTSMGAEGMDLKHETTALVADRPEDFADAVVRLYQDRQLWERLAEAGREHARARWDPAAVTRELEAAIESAVRIRRARRRLAGRAWRRLRRLWMPARGPAPGGPASWGGGV